MKVGDLVDAGYAEIKTGPFGTQLRASDYVASGRPVLNVRNVGFGDVRSKYFEYVDEETAARLSTHILQVDDIVFGRKGAVERHAIINAKLRERCKAAIASDSALPETRRYRLDSLPSHCVHISTNHGCKRFALMARRWRH